MDRGQELSEMSDTGDAATIAALRRAGIAPAGRAVSLAPLSGGVSCDVWLAQIEGEAPVVVKRALPQLRVAAEWLAPVERAENEVRWLRRGWCPRWWRACPRSICSRSPISRPRRIRCGATN